MLGSQPSLLPDNESPISPVIKFKKYNYVHREHVKYEWLDENSNKRCIGAKFLLFLQSIAIY